MNEAETNQPIEWTEQKLRNIFALSSDVKVHSYRFGPDDGSSDVVLVYTEGLCNNEAIGRTVLPSLHQAYQQMKFADIGSNRLFGILPLIPFEGKTEIDKISASVFQGNLVLLFPGQGELFRIDIGSRPERSPEESSTEISIKGPKDGFIEDIAVNVALIRKRIRSDSLCYETTLLGRRTQTKIGLLYIRDIISPKILNEVRSRLTEIDVDGVYSVSQLEEALADAKYSLFPSFDNSGRPDFAVASLLAGRFVIIVDGIPIVLIGPANISLLLKSPEDIHFTYQYTTFSRLIRLVSFLVAIYLPGFWVALTAFHQDQIPFRLMATVAVARLGLPVSAQMEMFLLLIMLEIFREAGVRLPSTIGQTLTVVGGLIIGDAAIRVGLVSPSVVVVGAMTAVAGATLVNQTLSTVVSVIRLIIFFICSVIGMYGLILSMILLTFYMSRLHSFGVPFLAPLSPPIFKDMISSFFRIPWSLRRTRPETLHTIDSDHYAKEEEP